MLMLGSCGMIDGQRDGRFRAGSTPLTSRGVSDLPIKIGAPYTIGGVTYTPADVRNYRALGYASWYGEELNGNRTANGERFEPSAVSAAHRTLPLPSYIEVTALTTGRTILVRVNDRGPFTQARELDLSRGAAEQLGILGGGAVPVRVRRVEPAEAERAVLRSGRRLAERATEGKTSLAQLRGELGIRPQPASYTAAPVLPELGLYTVQIASFTSKDRAEALAARVGANIRFAGSAWRVAFGPYTSAGEAHAGVSYAASKGFRDAIIIANDDVAETSAY